MIVTFYSFKGGVGRTLALANVGVVLAQSAYRVLLVDFDLEAPGLTRYLENVFGGDLLLKPGLLELLEGQRDCGDAGDLLHRFTVQVLRTPDGGHLDLMTSGYQDESYPRRILGFDWPRFFREDDGGDFFESCRREWSKRYDFVLVDSRTGITDSGGICTIQLPDIIVPVFTASRQSVEGVIDVVRRAQEGRQLLAYDRALAAIVPLPSRFDSRTEYALAQQWLDEFEVRFADFYASWLPQEASVREALERTKLPYVPFFSFGERLPVFEESGSDPESLSYALRAFSRLLESGLQDVGSVTTPGRRFAADEGGSNSEAERGPRRGGDDRLVVIAEDTFQRLDPAGRQAARQLLLRMISIGLGGADTVRRVSKDELLSLSPNPVASTMAFDAFVDAKVIHVDGTYAELAGEVLLQSWSRIRGWIEADRTDLYIRQSLTEAATRWRRDGRPISALYSNDSLAVAEIWAQDASNYRDLGQLERDFLSASQAARGQVKTPFPRGVWPKRLLILIAGLISLALIVGLIIIVPFMRSSPDGTPSPPSPLTGGVSTVLAAHTNIVTDVQFGPDGRTLASSSADGTVRLWNVVDPSRPTSFGQPLPVSTAGVTSVAFGPVGQVLAAGSDDGTVLLWDVSDPARPRRLGEPLDGHTGSVTSVAFAPDGRALATGGDDGTVLLWEVSDPTRPQRFGAPLLGHIASITSVAFSPDGRLLASGSTDSTVRLWDAATGQPHGQPLTGHSAAITSVAFSPDGRILASGSTDSTVRLWDAATGRPDGQPLTGHRAAVTSVAFSPDGTRVASGSTDQSVRLWDAATHRAAGQPLTGPTASVTSVSIKPDGSFIAGGSADQTVALWRLN